MSAGLTTDQNSDAKVDQGKLDKFAKDNLTAIGIDIGGTKIRAAVVQNRKLICEPVQISTPHGADVIVEDLLKIIGDFQKNMEMSFKVSVSPQLAWLIARLEKS